MKKHTRLIAILLAALLIVPDSLAFAAQGLLSEAASARNVPQESAVASKELPYQLSLQKDVGNKSPESHDAFLKNTTSYTQQSNQSRIFDSSDNLIDCDALSDDKK